MWWSSFGVVGGLGARSLHQRFVGQPLAGNAVNKAVEPLQRMPLDMALVEPERELVNVAAKMLRTGVVIDANQAALQNRENALDAVGRYVVADELGSTVVDGFVIEEQAGEAAIAVELLSIQPQARLDVLMNDPVNGGLIGAF